MGGKLDSPMLAKLEEAMPYIKTGMGIVAELAIPPPGDLDLCLHSVFF